MGGGSEGVERNFSLWARLTSMLLDPNFTFLSPSSDSRTLLLAILKGNGENIMWYEVKICKNSHDGTFNHW